MKTICRKLIILLALCALPIPAGAAENAAGDQKSLPAQPAPQAVTEKAPKTSEPVSSKSTSQKPSATALPTVALPAAAVTPQTVPDAVKPQQAIVIGYVDLVRVSTESEPGKSGQIKLIEKKQKLQTQIEAKRKQLDKQKAAIEAKLPTLTPGQREAKAKEFQKKVVEYQNFVEKAEKELQDLQQELSRALFEMIEKAASDYGKSSGLALVTVKRDLVYLAGNVTPQDVTEGVVKLINETMQKK